MNLPDPIGDTILQKMEQDHISTTEKSFEGNKIDSKNDTENRKEEEERLAPTLEDSILKTMNGSLLELQKMKYPNYHKKIKEVTGAWFPKGCYCQQNGSDNDKLFCYP